MASKDETAVCEMLTAVCPELNDMIKSYLSGMVADDPEDLVSTGLAHTVGLFLESLHVADVEEKCAELTAMVEDHFSVGSKAVKGSSSSDDAPKLLAAPVSVSSLARQEETEEEKALRESMWGLNELRRKYNLTYINQDKDKKKRKKKVRKPMVEDEEDLTRVSSMRLPTMNSGTNDRNISIEGASLSAPDGTELLDNAELKLAYGRRYGLVGKNGVGKTTLLKAMARFDLNDFPTHLRVLHVRQEVAPSDKSVVEVVMESDVERMMLLAQEQEILERQDKRSEEDSEGAAESAEDAKAAEEDSEKLQKVYERLEAIGASSAEARARMILAGLQFTEEQANGPTSDLSGGWRMRVSLAAALLIQPDVLLLDEPTNHLDLEAVIWLQNYLVHYPHTVMVVSHDRSFLNTVVTDIILFHKQKLEYFRTDYDHFVVRRAEKLREQRRIYEAHMAKRQHMQEFVDKFRANAKRASLVQSRIKAIEKMDREGVEDVEEEKPFRFTLSNPEALGRPIVSIEGLTFGFPPRQKDEAEEPLPVTEDRLLFKDVHFGIDLDSRLVLVGANGAGKSTLLNLVLGKLRPVAGEVHVNPRLRIGVFTQHATEAFDMLMTPVENMMAQFPGAEPAACRAFLGRYQISGDIGNRPMGSLSGGQKARVAFAFLAFKRPHLVIMDEPTNHLDMDAIDALVIALKDFKGGVVAVSHDSHVINNVCNEMWVVEDRRVSRVRGGYDEYAARILRKVRAHQEALVGKKG